MKFRWIELAMFLLIALLLGNCQNKINEKQTLRPETSITSGTSSETPTIIRNLNFTSPQTPTITKTQTSMVIITEEAITSSPTATSIPTITKIRPPILMTMPPYPTTTDLQIKEIFDLLQAATCPLPCYLGIWPGLTSFKDAKSQLENLGAGYFSQGIDTIGGYKLKLHMFQLDLYGTTGRIKQTIDVYEYDKLVIRMDIYAGSYLDPVFEEFWDQLSIINQPKNLGIPDKVYFMEASDTRNTVLVQYNNEGILLKNNMVGRNLYLECPRFTDEPVFHVFMVLFDSTFFDALAASSHMYRKFYNFEDGIPVLDPKYFIPIETALGITPQEFYEQIIADPEICFERVD